MPLSSAQRQKRHKDRKRAAGICVDCNDLAEPDRRQCKKHLKASREHMRRCRYYGIKGYRQPMYLQIALLQDRIKVLEAALKNQKPKTRMTNDEENQKPETRTRGEAAHSSFVLRHSDLA